MNQNARGFTGNVQLQVVKWWNKRPKKRSSESALVTGLCLKLSGSVCTLDLGLPSGAENDTRTITEQICDLRKDVTKGSD